MTINRVMLGGLIALLAAAAAFFFLRGDGVSATGEAQTVVDLPAGLEREDLEVVIRDYILAHPEIIPEAMERLQQRRSVAMISAVREQLETPFAGAWAGAADADVTIVEFFDYACSFCRASLGDVDRLLREDDRLRVVFRELPILSRESEQAARVSLAAAKQRDFMGFHRAMFAAGRPSAVSIAAAQQTAGIDRGRINAELDGQDIAAEIASNLDLARRLELTGTPVFVVGDQLLTGAVGYERLKEAVEEARTPRPAEIGSTIE